MQPAIAMVSAIAMLPIMCILVGIMVGFYIITHCLSLASRKDDREEPRSVYILCLITILLTFIIIFGLVVFGLSLAFLPLLK